jgi:putative Mn2+ efflux pump MntP
MPWADLLALAFLLSTDALAVAIAVGVTLRSGKGWHPFRLGLSFGLFQSCTVILGWIVGISIRERLAAWAAWFAFALLFFLGVKTMVEAVRGRERLELMTEATRGWNLLVLSTATSIDGLVIGVPLALAGFSIWKPALVIGVAVAALTIGGVLLGGAVGKAWGRWAEIAGGFGLCAVGAKILLVHMFGR